jgi:hypothetical protein
VVEPSEEPDPNAGEGLLHYPFARAAASAAGGQRVLWIDAARGRVLGADRDPAGAAPRPTVALAGAFATYFAIGIALPLPWSLAAMGVATPFLLRWTERRLVGEA